MIRNQFREFRGYHICSLLFINRTIDEISLFTLNLRFPTAFHESTLRIIDNTSHPRYYFLSILFLFSQLRYNYNLSHHRLLKKKKDHPLANELSLTNERDQKKKKNLPTDLRRGIPLFPINSTSSPLRVAATVSIPSASTGAVVINFHRLGQSQGQIIYSATAAIHPLPRRVYPARCLANCYAD